MLKIRSAEARKAAGRKHAPKAAPLSAAKSGK